MAPPCPKRPDQVKQSAGRKSGPICPLGANTVIGAKVNEHIDKGVPVGDGVPVAKLGAFNTQVDCLREDTFDGRPLFIELLVSLSVTVQLEPNARTDAGWHGHDTTTLGPTVMVNGAGAAGGLRVEQGTSIATTLMNNQACAIDEGALKRHG